jgi:hypothetical protein
VAGSFAVRVGDPAAGAATAASFSSSEIWKVEPRAAAADAPVALGELEPAPGPPQVAPTVTDGAIGESGAGGACGALSDVWVTCVVIASDASARSSA